MACPFSRRSSGNLANGALKRSFTSRQNSFQIPDDDEESKTTLTLRHLNSAILILTAPPNEALQVALASLIQKEEQKEPGRLSCLDQLPKNVTEIHNYAYLEDIFDVVSLEKGIEELGFMVKLGVELVQTACKDRLEKAFRCLGGDLKEFLTTLDGVHDVLKYQETSDVETEIEAFTCTIISDEKLQLDFTTERPSVAYLLAGSLKGIAKMLYSTEANITVDQSETDSKQFRFNIEFSNEDSVEELTKNKVYSGAATDLNMDVVTFCKAFPWHFIMDRRLELVQLGTGFMRLFGNLLTSLGASVCTYFKFQRPRNITLSFSEIIKRANTPFVLVINSLKMEGKLQAEGLELKGQMVFCPESDSILFIGSPFIDGLEGLTGSGLFISDIPLHDATRDVILVGEQARAQDGLRRRMDKLKSSIEEGNRAVDKERERNVNLLHLLFPPDIAKRLWLGQTIEAKTHEDVTMLFSDIVGFTTICSTATPMMVIDMLQSLYNQFDIYCGQLDVYKQALTMD